MSDAEDYLHDVRAIATAIMRINNNIKQIDSDIEFIKQQMDEIHKDVFHHLPVSRCHSGKTSFSSFMAARRRTK